jgi:hypothetical protein
MRRLAFACVALAATLTCSPSVGRVLLFDDFSGSHLDASKWTVNQARAGNVRVDNGVVELRNGGTLVTARQYDPKKLGGIKITGQYTTLTGFSDTMIVQSRSDGGLARTGRKPNGIYADFKAGSAPLYPARFRSASIKESASPDNANELARTYYDTQIGLGDTFFFDYIDTGDRMILEITDTNGKMTASVTATSGLRSALNFAAISNRENIGKERLSVIDNITISTLSEVPVPGAMVLTLSAFTALAGVYWRSRHHGEHAGVDS